MEEVEVVRDIALGNWSRTLQLVLLLLAAGPVSAITTMAGRFSRV